MPKKQTRKNKSQTWKVMAMSLGLALVISGVTAQVLFNRETQWKLDQLAVFQTRTLIVDAIDTQTELKSEPDSHHRIPEARLQLPAPNTSIGKVVYTYDKADGSTPESIQITTRGLTDLATGQLNALTVKGLFDRARKPRLVPAVSPSASAQSSKTR